ncbi:MAG: hypothetical protein ACFFAN_09345 [Promethearchaeota archaeon]
MSKKPPYCYLCEKNFEKSLENLHYCICDIAICNKCINSVKKSTNIWICPKCRIENDVEKSRLFRTK